MPGPKKVSPQQAWELQRLYHEEKDSQGRPKWTIQKLADLWDMGETTMHRIVMGIGPYRRHAPSEPQISVEDREAAARSFERLQVELAKNGDHLLEELVKAAGTENAPIGDEAKERAKRLLGERE